MPKLRVCFQGAEGHVVEVAVESGPSSSHPTLGSLRRDFPFRGDYHFRIQTPSDAVLYEYAWRDLVDEADEIPADPATLIKAIPADVQDEYDLSVDADASNFAFEEDAFVEHFASSEQTPEPAPIRVAAASPAVQRTRSEPAPKGSPGLMPASPSLASDPMAAFSKSLFSGARAALEAVKKNVAGADPYA